jgi:hypothetical protein
VTIGLLLLVLVTAASYVALDGGLVVPSPGPLAAMLVAALVGVGGVLLVAACMAGRWPIRGSWTVNDYGVIFEPQVGAVRIVPWSQVRRVRRRRCRLDLDTGSACLRIGSRALSGRQWQELEAAIRDRLAARFPPAVQDCDETGAWWSRSPRWDGIVILANASGLMMLAAVLQGQLRTPWPAAAVVLLVAAQLAARWFDLHRRPWQMPDVETATGTITPPSHQVTEPRSTTGTAIERGARPRREAGSPTASPGRRRPLQPIA